MNENEWWEDDIIHNVTVHLSFCDRVKVLFGKTLYVDGRIKCEYAPGRVEGSSKPWVARWFPTREQGQSEIARPDA